MRPVSVAVTEENLLSTWLGPTWTLPEHSCCSPKNLCLKGTPPLKTSLCMTHANQYQAKPEHWNWIHRVRQRQNIYSILQLLGNIGNGSCGRLGAQNSSGKTYASTKHWLLWCTSTQISHCDEEVYDGKLWIRLYADIVVLLALRCLSVAICGKQNLRRLCRFSRSLLP